MHPSRFSHVTLAKFIVYGFLPCLSCCSGIYEQSLMEMSCGEDGEACNFPQSFPSGNYPHEQLNHQKNQESRGSQENPFVPISHTSALRLPTSVKKPIDVLIVMDNSETMQKYNDNLVGNFTQFLQCIEPLDWRLGIISSVHQKHHSGGRYSQYPIDDSHYRLMRMEVEGQVSGKNYLSPGTYNYQRIFSDTISLRSGCHLPPYCVPGDNKPLASFSQFMDHSYNSRFLRPGTPLLSIIVSLKDEHTPYFSDRTTAGKAMQAVTVNARYAGSTAFINSTVTDLGSPEDCIRTTQDYFFAGSTALEILGHAYYIVSFNPFAFLATQALRFANYQLRKPARRYNEIKNFAAISGGKVLDLCSPFFGRGLAYHILDTLGESHKFPEKCRKAKKRKRKSPFAPI